MKLTTILFDLDGTLLPMDQDNFIKLYFGGLAKKLVPYGYEPQKLIECIYAGTSAMVKNDGSRTNEEVFWDTFETANGKPCCQDEPVFDHFYRNEFVAAKAACGYAPEAKEIVDFLNANGITVILATNPLFPPVATENRMAWAGLAPEDFALYTTYDNSSYCKPNPKYYAEILEKLNLNAEDCLMVGNDVSEDMVAETLGMKVFLLTDCLLNTKNLDILKYPQGSFAELKTYLKSFV